MVNQDNLHFIADFTGTFTIAIVMVPEKMSIEELQGLLNGYAAARGLLQRPEVVAAHNKLMSSGQTLTVNLDI